MNLVLLRWCWRETFWKWCHACFFHNFLKKLVKHTTCHKILVNSINERTHLVVKENMVISQYIHASWVIGVSVPANLHLVFFDQLNDEFGQKPHKKSGKPVQCTTFLKQFKHSLQLLRQETWYERYVRIYILCIARNMQTYLPLGKQTIPQ